MEQLNIFDQFLLDEKDSDAKKKITEKSTRTEEKVLVSYEDFDFDGLNLYAGIDCIATSELLRREFPSVIVQEKIKGSKGEQIKAPPIIDSFLSLEIPAHEFIIDMEINGMDYSVLRNRWISEKMQVQLDELDEKIFSSLGKKLDLNSGKKVAEFLYGEKEFKPPNFTKAGEPATDGQALMTLAGLDPLGGKYITQDADLQWLADMAMRRDLFSTHNTFIKTYVRDFVKRDGKIHPSYNQFGTSSFRITGSDPNLTQLPRNKHGYNIRTCYIVESGHVFISFDFSSAEVKVLANIANEPTMLKAIADGMDFHTFSASSMRGIPYAEMMGVLADSKHSLYKEYKGLRQLSKVLTFSILYGSSNAGIAAQLGIPKSQADSLISLYFTTFPKIKNYIENSHKFSLANQMSLTPLGQRRRQYGTYSVFKPTAAYNASMRGSQNMIIQSTTSTIGLATFAELNERIKPFGAKSICTVYDSIEISCPIEKAAEVINLAYSTLDEYPLEAFPFLQLPIGCEGDVGISWGETEVVHPGVTQLEINNIISTLTEKSKTIFGQYIY